MLGLEAEGQVELVPNGGAFGGRRISPSRPTQPFLPGIRRRYGSRCQEESVLMHPKRSRAIGILRGCDAEGPDRRAGADCRGFGRLRPVGDKVMERAAGCLRSLSGSGHDIESLAVYTNNPKCGASGFGEIRSFA